jgi:hypothetical protein
LELTNFSAITCKKMNAAAKGGDFMNSSDSDFQRIGFLQGDRSFAARSNFVRDLNQFSQMGWRLQTGKGGRMHHSNVSTNRIIRAGGRVSHGVITLLSNDFR